jgi:hypothetical protein
MKKFYVIQSINGHGFWNFQCRKFMSYLYADMFEDFENALNHAKKENVRVFKITEVYDSK